MEAGSVVNTPVSFMDFGPTALKLAGVKKPKDMDGEAIIGAKIDDDRSVFCYGDRFDDLYAFNRVVRKGKFRYARNFQPYHAQGLHAYYRYKSLAFNEWREMYHKGLLNKAQANFFEVFGPEELYDLSKDPKELNNLAYDPAYKQVVKSLRKEVFSNMLSKGDVGLYPECIFIEEGIKNASAFAASHTKEMKKYIELANTQFENYSEVKEELLDQMSSDDMVARWWALTSLCYFANDAKADLKNVKAGVAKNAPAYLRARLLVLQSLAGQKASKQDYLDVLNSSTSLAETLLVLNDYAFLSDSKLLPAITFESAPFTSYSVTERINYLNK